MDNIIGLITANYGTEKLGELTSQRTIASLPFGGRYRLIDFTLSNMVNSKIKTVGIITPYKYRSIIDHIGAGKEWSLDRKNGGLFVLPGSVFGISSTESRFLLRDIDHNRVFLVRSPAPYVLVSASNTVCNMDYTGLFEAHRRSGADITLAYKRAAEDSEYVTGINVSGGRVTGMLRGVRAGGNGFLDCFIINRNLLLKMLDWYAAIDYLDIFEALTEDYDKVSIGLYEYSGYAAAIFDTQSYFHRSMDLLNRQISNELFFRERPIMTKIQDAVPTKYMKDAVVRNSLVPAGCIIGGTVEGSVLFRGVQVEKGAVVKNSIIMQSCVIGCGARVENAIIDRSNIICAGNVIKGSADSTFIKEKSFTKEKNLTGVT